jgi:hypothetical protein
VFINAVYRFPWIGMTLQIGDLAVSANREWSAYGVARLSGFSRSSYDCAMAILVFYGYLVTLSRGVALKAAIAAISGAAIAMTTAKGAAGAFLLALLLGPMLGAVRTPNSLWRWPCLAVAGGLAAIGLAAPLVSSQIPFPQLTEGSPAHWLFSSMLERAWDTWPQALALLSDSQTLTGRGLGGIGAAQYIFEAGRENPADNLFVYLYVTAGLIGAAFYVWLPLASLRLRLDDPAGRIAFLTLLAVLAYGVSANVIENAIFALALGMATAWLAVGQVPHRAAAAAQLPGPSPLPAHERR